MTKLTSILALGAFAGVANAECPNACSGHGICVQFDMCQCYRNWQGNDCSARTCPVGYAHVDSPRGDLDMSGGALSGPDTTVIKLSEVFPMGTTEQYPDALENEAHFYMECSNKGLCDRKLGECKCFDGYDGDACQRASCPGGDGGASTQCSGHGTCHSIARLTEKFSYTGLPLEVRGEMDEDTGAFADGTQAYYGLWDKNSTRGCACDSPYEGADCSSRACKVGIDPIFNGWAVHNQPMIMIDCKDVEVAPMGTFTILFTSALGQTYRTGKLSVDATADDVKEALLALPNSVVPDVEVVDYTAKTVQDDNDVAFMITFPNNPGARAGLEIDTSDIDCDDFDKADPVVFPNVGFRQVGSNSDIYTYHAADIAFAQNGHKLLYLKSKLVGDFDEDAPPVVKIEDKLYVVEQHGELTPDGLAFVVLHTPYEGEDIDGDSQEQNNLMKNVANAWVQLSSDGHINKIHLTDSTGQAIADNDLGSGFDKDGDLIPEALDYFTEGEYYLFKFDIENLEELVGEASITHEYEHASEYCIVYVPYSQYSTDTTSTSGTAGEKKIGINLVPSAGRSYVPLDLASEDGDVDGVNCPMGYKNVEYTKADDTVSRDSASLNLFHFPLKMSHFFLERDKKVSSKYQSTHQATGGAVLQSAYSRITSQTARGTTRVYLTAKTNYQTATPIGEPLTLTANVGQSKVAVIANGNDSGDMGDVFLIGTERNVASEDWEILDSTPGDDVGEISLKNIFTGSGEGQETGNYKLTGDYAPGPGALTSARTANYDINSDTDPTHLVTLYKLQTDAETTPVEYVLPCSGRGNCDGASGLCKCFKGYTNDNCDSQSVLFNGKK